MLETAFRRLLARILDRATGEPTQRLGRRRALAVTPSGKSVGAAEFFTTAGAAFSSPVGRTTGAVCDCGSPGREPATLGSVATGATRELKERIESLNEGQR